MAKINVLASGRSSIFTSRCLRPLLEPYFEIISPQQFHSGSYNVRDTVIVASNWVWSAEEQQLKDQGYPIIIDNLWEPTSTWRREYPENFDSTGVTVLNSERFFWCHEYFLQQYHLRTNKVQLYTPVRNIKYTALMQMRLARRHRTRLWDALGERKHKMLYSYLEMGHHNLPGDTMSPNNYLTNYDAQREFCPEWYNSTGFTLVAETHEDSVNSMEFGTNKIKYQGPWPFITEKTIKPIQYQHPFVIWGMSNILATLKNWGFVTFDNLFDESYDSIQGGIHSPWHPVKIQKILQNFDNFKINSYDAETQARIAHNHARFNDQHCVEEIFLKDVIEPIVKALEHG